MTDRKMNLKSTYCGITLIIYQKRLIGGQEAFKMRETTHHKNLDMEQSFPYAQHTTLTAANKSGCCAEFFRMLSIRNRFLTDDIDCSK